MKYSSSKGRIFPTLFHEAGMMLIPEPELRTLKKKKFTGKPLSVIIDSKLSPAICKKYMLYSKRILGRNEILV